MLLKAFEIVLFGYLLGSFPSAYIAGRLVKGIDIREVGDRNMGTANTFREVGALAGICVGIADVGKGVLAILGARFFGAAEVIVLLTGLAVVAGHNWPFALHFRGGRGAATTLGVLLTLMPREMSILLVAAAMPLVVTHNMNLTCGVLFAPLPFLAWWLGTPTSLVTYSVALPCLVGFTHFITTRHLPDTVERQGGCTEEENSSTAVERKGNC